MAVILAKDYKGYIIRMAAFQPSKARRTNNPTRSVQAIKNDCIKKTVRFETRDPYGAGKAQKKIQEWIDKQQND